MSWCCLLGNAESQAQSTRHAGQYGKLYSGQSTQYRAEKASHTAGEAHSRDKQGTCTQSLLCNMENLTTGQGTGSKAHARQGTALAQKFGQMYAGQGTPQTSQAHIQPKHSRLADMAIWKTLGIHCKKFFWPKCFVALSLRQPHPLPPVHHPHWWWRWWYGQKTTRGSSG